jgi:uncharacterized membrane protein
MPADNDTGEEPLIFSAQLRPYRSLPRAGFILVMSLVAGVSFVAGMVFLLMGAWPVFGFFGLDVLLVYIAFRVNYRRAGAYEEVTVTPSALVVRKVSHRGKAQQWTLNPVWARLHCDTHAEFGVEDVFLVSHGRRLALARCLGRSEKEDFAAALGAALAEARRGPTRTVLD